MRDWLKDFSEEMGRPANEVIAELLSEYSMEASAGIVGVSAHTLKAHCIRAGITWTPNKQPPDRKQYERDRNDNRSRMLTLNGKTLHLAEWSRRTGISSRTIHDRLKRGWSDHDALTVPVGARKATGSLHWKKKVDKAKKAG